MKSYKEAFNEFRNDGEHESLSDKHGYIELMDIHMIHEFFDKQLDLLTQEVEDMKIPLTAHWRESCELQLNHQLDRIKQIIVSLQGQKHAAQ